MSNLLRVSANALYSIVYCAALGRIMEEAHDSRRFRNLVDKV